MTSSPQPMQVTRRRGAKRGDHGTYVTTVAGDTTAATPSGVIGSDNPRSTNPSRRRVPKPTTDAAAAAKAAYDARPKVIFRGVDEDLYYKLRAIYKDQLHRPGGIEGWSEFGREVLLRQFVDQYEQAHGEMSGGEDVELPAGRRAE